MIRRHVAHHSIWAECSHLLGMMFVVDIECVELITDLQACVAAGALSLSLRIDTECRPRCLETIILQSIAWYFVFWQLSEQILTVNFTNHILIITRHRY